MWVLKCVTLRCVFLSETRCELDGNSFPSACSLVIPFTRHHRRKGNCMGCSHFLRRHRPYSYWLYYTPDLSYFAPVSMEQANYRIRTPPKRNMRVKFPSLTQLLWTMMESFWKKVFLREDTSAMTVSKQISKKCWGQWPIACFVGGWKVSRCNSHCWHISITGRRQP